MLPGRLIFSKIVLYFRCRIIHSLLGVTDSDRRPLNNLTVTILTCHLLASRDRDFQR